MRGTPLIAVVLVCVLFVPFLGKPFHVDDANYIALSKAIDLPFGTVPGVRLHQMGEVIENLSPLASTHPPLIQYVLRLVSACRDQGSGDTSQGVIAVLTAVTGEKWFGCRRCGSPVRPGR